MFEIIFYKDKRGREPVLDYILELDGRTDKDSRVKAQKIYKYIDFLSHMGLRAPEPYIKRLEGDIWEMRPLRDRILFAAWDASAKSFILLHCFMKQTQKTPKREIEKAKRNLADYRERTKGNE